MNLTFVFRQLNRRQHFSYPYWTDFAYRSSPYGIASSSRTVKPRISPWVGFHLLILLSVVLVFLTQSEPSSDIYTKVP